jgi:hypothetical protein
MLGVFILDDWCANVSQYFLSEKYLPYSGHFLWTGFICLSSLCNGSLVFVFYFNLGIDAVFTPKSLKGTFNAVKI